MDEEMARIWRLIGKLSDARWQHAAQLGVSALQVTLSESYPPEDPTERAVWNELTSPQNYGSLRRYVRVELDEGVTDFAKKLFGALLMDAEKRWDSQGIGPAPR